MDFPLPAGLPEPLDDGSAEHLTGLSMAPVALLSTAGTIVNLSKLLAPRTVLYCYSMMGVPGKPITKGWGMIPGARGCTPQTCGFRDQHAQLSALNAEVFGCSTQTTDFQQEMASRLHSPFEVLSDAEFKLCDALRLPTFLADGARLLKRLTLIIRRGKIEKVFYPVFPPNESANQALRWVTANPIS